MSKIKNTINAIEPKITMGGVDEAKIKEAESQLNLNFSLEYREFLSEFGAALIAGNEFLGLATEESLNTVVQTSEQRNSDTTFPRKMYIVSDLHIDGLKILQNEDGEIYEYISSALPRKIFDSLSEYIKDTIS